MKRALFLFCVIALISCSDDATPPSKVVAPPVTGVSDPGEAIADQALLLASEGSHQKAAELFMQAAQQGNRPAQYFIGLMYARGDGVQQNFEEAFRWLHKAAWGGHPKAVYHLGEMYVQGDGVEIDHVKAMAWFWVGTTLGDRYSEKRLRATAPRLSHEEMSEAKLLSKEINRKIPHDLKIERMRLH